MTRDDDQISDRLQEAATWAAAVPWELNPEDVRPLRSDAGRSSYAKPHGRLRLSPRLIWVLVVVAAIATVATIPELSTHTAAGTGSTAHNRGRKPKGRPTNSPPAPCKTTVKGVFSTPLGPVELPVSPGRIITRSQAIRAALTRANGDPALPPGLSASEVFATKLSSWTEVETLLGTTVWGREKDLVEVPEWLLEAPWTPVWAVLVRSDAAISEPPDGPPRNVDLVEAAYGSDNVFVLHGANHDTSWFSALTDRDPSLAGCPGGSSTRVPFGVLTRDEEIYDIRDQAGPNRTLVIKLTTVPALYAADPGLFGGCIRQNCTLDQLIWPWITVVKAPPGKEIACPVWSSPGPEPQRLTKEYFTISVPASSESGCNPLPAAMTNLRDLSPPGN